MELANNEFSKIWIDQNNEDNTLTGKMEPFLSKK